MDGLCGFVRCIKSDFITLAGGFGFLSEAWQEREALWYGFIIGNKR